MNPLEESFSERMLRQSDDAAESKFGARPNGTTRIKTPLEELQAAHKRLSELRDKPQNGRAWKITRGGVDGIVNCRHEQADLIVTLHRTVDAQLHILKSAAHFAYGEVDAEALELARAINGEAS